MYLVFVVIESNGHETKSEINVILKHETVQLSLTLGVSCFIISHFLIFLNAVKTFYVTYQVYEVT